MSWQDVSPLNVSHIDVEEERELRLAAQARAGAEWALAALVARYQPPVTRYLTRLTGDPDIARALAEAIFVRMEKRLRGPQGGQRLRLWVLRACTEAGLDVLRHPHQHRAAAPQLHGPSLAGLLPERAGEGATRKLRAGLGALANITGSTSRQVRGLIWSPPPETARRARKPLPPQYPDRGGARARKPPPERRTPPLVIEEDLAEQDPREALRFRMVRAVLAELPYGDAQCLALHLIAGMNQAEVARALGITNSATRRRIVHGLQLFAQRYEAAAASLGISPSALAAAGPPSPPASVPSPEDERAGIGEALAAPGAPITPVLPEEVAREVEALPFSFSAPAAAADDGTDMPAQDEREPEGGHSSPEANEAPVVIVETTAVVHDASVAGPPEVDLSVGGVQEMASPDVVASEQASPSADADGAPDATDAIDATDATSGAFSSAAEEWDVAEDAMVENASTGEIESASVIAEAAVAEVAEAEDLAGARVVPILTVPSAGAEAEAEARATADWWEERVGLVEEEREAAVAPASTRPVRLIPVLTAATPEVTGAATVDAPPDPAITFVRTVPVLTPTAPPASPPHATRLVGDDMNADTVSRETLALTAMTPEDATLDASS